MDSYSGVYIFEGIDNVGKTTIIQALKQKIQETTDYKCVNVAFPGNEPRTLGNLVYRIHHQQEQYFDVPINETSLQILHIAAHIDLIHRQLKPLGNSRCINIKKIFLIERNKRQKDYGSNKENAIIGKYRELAEKEVICEKLNNNESLEEATDKVYKSIFGE